MIADGDQFNGRNEISLTARAYGMSQAPEFSAAADAEEAASGINPAAILHSLRRSWKIAFPIAACLAVAGAAAGWILIVPKYTATGYLRIDGDNRPLIFETADARGGGSFDLYKSTQQQLMVTPFVLNAALRDEELSALPVIKSERDPVSWLKEELQVGFPGDGEIMTVSVEASSPSACVTIVNSVVDSYMDEVVISERNERLRRLEDLEKVYTDAEGRVRKKQNELKNLAAALGTGDSESLTVAQQAVLQQYGLMQEKLFTVQFELMQAEGAMRVFQEVTQKLAENQADAESTAEQESTADGDEMPEDPNDVPELASTALRTPDILNLESQLSTLKAKYNADLQSYGFNHPTTKTLSAQVAGIEALLAERRKYAEEAALENAERRMIAERLAKQGRSMPGASGQLNPSGFDDFDEISLSARIDVLKHHEKTLTEKVAELELETRALGQSSIDVELMRAEIAQLDDVLQRVGAEIERTTIEMRPKNRIEFISRAETAAPPELKKRFAATGGLAMMGLLAPFVLLVGWDLQRKSVDDADTASGALSVSSFGTIPKISGDPLASRSLTGSRRYQRQRTMLSESVDSVSGMILHHANCSGHQVFMVTSALAGEGKSTTTCQLGESLARSGKRVVIVDFDLRRPSISRYMKLERAPGVSETLHQRVAPEDAIQESGIKNLSVLTAGSEIGDLYERSTGHAIGQLFEALRRDYDIVIVDACPVLPVVDARIIATYCDGVILSLIRDKSRLPAAARACELLRSYGVNVLGTIVIGATPSYYSNVYQYAEDDAPLEAAVN